MPQASQELRDMFPGSDAQAMNVLEEHFTWDKPKLWIIRPKVADYKMTEREGYAIDYLCDEWDFGYEPA
jgi:hypothetical protein